MVEIEAPVQKPFGADDVQHNSEDAHTQVREAHKDIGLVISVVIAGVVQQKRHLMLDERHLMPHLHHGQIGDAPLRKGEVAERVHDR